MVLIHEAHQRIGLVALASSMLVPHRDKIPVRPIRYSISGSVPKLNESRNERDQAGVRRLTYLIDAKKGAA